MKSEKKDARQLSGYAHYSGMAFQMGIVIAGSAFGGVKLDQWLQLSPLFTIICSLAGVAIAMYLIIKDFIPSKNKHHDSDSH